MTDDTHTDGDPDVTGEESSETTASGEQFDFELDDFDRRVRIEPGEVERVFSVLETAVTDGELEEAEIERLLRVLETAIVSPIPIQSEEIDELLSILESTLQGSPGGQTVTEVLTVLESAILDPARLQTTESEGLLSVLESAIVGPTNRGTGVEDIFSLVDSFADPDRYTDADRDPEERGLFSLFDVTGINSEAAERTAEDAFSLFDPMNLSGRGRGRGRGERREREDPLGPEGEGSIADPFRIARIAAATTQRATDYSLRSGIRTGTRMVNAASTAGSLEELIEDSREIAFDEMERLGFDVGDRGSSREPDPWSDDARIQTEEVLRERGARLLEKSADIDHDDAIHPAFPNIINQLAADEARILRFLATEGPQPAVNIRDVGWVPISSELKAAGLSMIGTESGCRHEDRTLAYLNNLNRLGLVWFSDEPVDNIKRYQVVEAQPEVEDAITDCKRPKVIRRSIHLTPFGVDFCRVCLPIDVISEDASSVYSPPKDRTKQNGVDPQSPETRPAARGGGGRDTIRNPHRDDY